MTGLKHLNLAIGETTIKTTGGDFKVRGLNLTDLTILMRHFGGPLQELYAKYQAEDPEKIKEKLAGDNSLADFIASVPNLANAIIAAASGAIDDIEIASKLPITVQIEALEAIGKHTFEEHGGPKKVVEAVIRIMKALTATLSELQA